MNAVDDVLEPLPLYRDVFREAFHDNAARFFSGLVERSGVDTDANRRTADAARGEEALFARESSARAAWGWGVGIFAILLAAAALAAILAAADEAWDNAAVAAAAAVPCAAILFGLCVPRRREHAASAAMHRARADALVEEARRQMEPLNALFDWDIPSHLIESTVPRLKFDPFFTQGRLDQLRTRFGWDDAFNGGKSVIGAHSGEINGNPFVFARLLQMEWGTKTYTGHRTVSWTETEHGPDGKLRLVRRSQTLSASVTRPIPEYSHDVLLIYGNDAAPNLRFSREPTSLSYAGDGFVGRIRMKNRIKSLERFSRNLDDEFGYTIMGNREFEALFQTKDRSDEIEYRLLFTPLAQKQMLELLKDRDVGFGDDFSFLKRGRINIIRAGHLAKSDLDADPAKFAGYDLDDIRARFTAFAERFFKDTWFALAPLLSIPLYSQTRTHEDIYGTSCGRDSCFWEHESIANFLGEARFRHPLSATRNILKTTVERRDGGVATVDVTAHGFRIERRVASVPVMAANGATYHVDVPWDEYLPVSRTSTMHASERAGLSRHDFDAAKAQDASWADFFRNWGADAAGATLRRSVVTF